MTARVFSRQLPNIPQELLQRYQNIVDFSINTLITSIQQNAHINQMRGKLLALCASNNWNNAYVAKLQNMAAILALGYMAFIELYQINNTDAFNQVSIKIENLIEAVVADILLCDQEFQALLSNGDTYMKADATTKDLENELKLALTNITNLINRNIVPNQALYTPRVQQPYVQNNCYNNVRNNGNAVMPSRFDNNNQVNNLNIAQPTQETNNFRFDRNALFNDVIVNDKPKINEPYIKPVDNRGESIIVRFEDWKSTPTNPYLTLLTNESTRSFELVKGIVYERIKEGAKMDRKQHTISKDVTVNTEEAVKLVDSLTRKHFTATKEKDVEQRRIKMKEFIDPNPQLEISFEYAILNIKNTIMADVGDIQKSAYRRYELYVYKPFVSKHDYNYILEDLSNCSDYGKMATMLEDLIDHGIATDVSDDDKIRTLIYLQAINNHMTRYLNNFLSCGLGVETRMDSFAMDAPSVETHLQNHYGSVYSGAYRDFDYETANNILKFPIPLTDKVKESLVFDEHTNLTINYIPELYTLTFIGLLSNQLGIEKLEDDRPYLITKDKTPVIYNIAGSIFKNDNSVKDSGIYTHLIVTMDDQYFSIYKSYLGRDMFVLSKFNK